MFVLEISKKIGLEITCQAHYCRYYFIFLGAEMTFYDLQKEKNSDGEIKRKNDEISL